MQDTLSLRAARLAFGSVGTVLPEPMAALAERLYFSARKHSRPERERALLAQGEQFSVSFRDGDGAAVDVNAWRWSSDFPWERADRGTVLLVHGWEGRAAQLGAFVQPLVALGYTVVGADAPGHGWTRGAAIDLPAYAELVRALARREGDVRAVIAHSFGAAAATLALAGEGDDGADGADGDAWRVDGTGGGFAEGPATRAPGVTGRHGAPGLDVDGVVLVSPPCSLMRYAETFSRALGLTRATDAIFRARLEERFGREWWRHYALDARAGAVGDVPALVVHDHDDRETPFSEGARLAQAWEGAQLVETEGLGHRRILRDDAVVARVIEFIDENVTAADASRAA